MTPNCKNETHIKAFLERVFPASIIICISDIIYLVSNPSSIWPT